MKREKINLNWSKRDTSSSSIKQKKDRIEGKIKQPRSIYLHK